MPPANAPIRVVLTRDVVESEHVVDVAIVDPSGVRSHGEADRAVIPRSAIKSIQVLPLIESGAAERFGVTDVEIALGAASHSAEPDHIAAVRAWLDRIGLDESALECGADRPISRDAADACLAAGEPFGPIHNCCSGKHAGFLTIAVHLGIDPTGYISRDHAVQQLVSDAISRFTGVDTAALSSGIDGCGIPTFALPLSALASAMSALVTTEAPAPKRVVDALVPHAYWVAGTDRHEVRLAEAASEPLVSKGGAEGVFMAALPERGIGIALKARDGAARAAEAAISAVLHDLGVVDASLTCTDITNKAGTVVGTMEVDAR